MKAWIPRRLSRLRPSDELRAPDGDIDAHAEFVLPRIRSGPVDALVPKLIVDLQADVLRDPGGAGDAQGDGEVVLLSRF